MCSHHPLPVVLVLVVVEVVVEDLWEDMVLIPGRCERARGIGCT